MQDALDVSRYDLPAGALLNSVALDSAPGGRAQLLTQLRDCVAKIRTEQMSHSLRRSRKSEL